MKSENYVKITDQNIKRKNGGNKVFTALVVTLSSILLILLVFLATYSFMMGQSDSSYEKAVRASVKNINSVNDSMKSFIDGQTIDAKNTGDKLQSKIDLLVNEKDKLEALQTPNEYKLAYSNLISGLNYNIRIYEQILAILSTPESSDTESSIADLKKYKEDCMSYYSKVAMKDMKIFLTKNSVTFINNSISYTSQVAKLQIAENITQSQKSEFSNLLDNETNKFLALKLDFNTMLVKARSRQASYDDVIASITQNGRDFDNLKNDFSNVTVPSSAITVSDAFKQVLSDYNAYLENLKYAVTLEKSQSLNDTITNDFINSLYSTTNSKLNDVNKDYNNFSKLYSDFKASN